MLALFIPGRIHPCYVVDSWEDSPLLCCLFLGGFIPVYVVDSSEDSPLLCCLFLEGFINNLSNDLKQMNSLSSFKCEIQKWSGPECHCGYCLQCSLTCM